MKDATPLILARALLHSLPEQTPGITTNTSEDDVAAMANYSGLKLLLVDEANQLNEDYFRTLRTRFKKTGCPVVLVGT